MRKSMIILSVLASICASPAMASSDDAWAEMFANARATCTKAVQSHGPKGTIKVKNFTGSALGIGGKDNDLYYALTLTGTNGRYANSWLCLYDKRAKKAQVAIIEPAK
jgi:hypothetical protein